MLQVQFQVQIGITKNTYNLKKVQFEVLYGLPISRFRHEIPEKCRRAYRPKRRECNHKDEDNSPNSLSYNIKDIDKK